jgi:hypothetical protein
MMDRMKLAFNLVLSLSMQLLVSSPVWASEAAPLPGLPGSAVPPSATPSTSVHAAAPSAPSLPRLSAPEPAQSQPIRFSPAPAFSPESLAPAQRGSRRSVHAVRKALKLPATNQHTKESIGSPRSQGSLPSIGTPGSQNISIPQGAANNQSIESFFQISPSINVVADKAAPAQDHSHLGGIARALYHVLDNVGIPVPYKNNADLDPSITVPPPELSVEVKRLEKVSPPASQTSSQSLPQPPQLSQPNQQKIPTSELEGVELPTPGDVPKTTR